MSVSDFRVRPVSVIPDINKMCGQQMKRATIKLAAHIKFVIFRLFCYQARNITYFCNMEEIFLHR